MPGGAARDHSDAVDPLELLAVETERAVQITERAHRRRESARLLVDLFQHEVGIAVLLGRRGVPGDRRHGLLDGAAVEPDDPYALARQHGHLAVVEHEDVPRVPEDRRDVRGEEDSVRSHRDDQRRAAVLHAQEHPRRVGADDAERIGAVKRGRRTARRCFEPLARVLLDQVGHDLRVRLGAEPVAVALEQLPEVGVILDDAVVDDGDRARAVAMRMGVLVGGFAVGRPAGVGHTQLALRGLARQDALERGDLPDAPAHLETAIVDQRDTGGVVAAVLEPLEPVHQEWHGLLLADISDDSAHALSRLSRSICPPPYGRPEAPLKSWNP